MRTVEGAGTGGGGLWHASAPSQQLIRRRGVQVSAGTGAGSAVPSGSNPAASAGVNYRGRHNQQTGAEPNDASVRSPTALDSEETERNFVNHTHSLTHLSSLTLAH